MLHKSRVLIAGLLLASSACAHRSGAAADSDQGRPPAPEVSVYVTNRYSVSLEVSVTGSGSSYRLGLVTPGIPRSFVLPQAFTASGGQVEFSAQASGGGSVVRTAVVTIRPGDIVDFDIATNLIGSRAVVRY